MVSGDGVQLDIFDAIALDDVAQPVDVETSAKLHLVSHDWRSEQDWERFEHACRTTATPALSDLSSQLVLIVDPNLVRSWLSNEYGLMIEPRRYSSFWHRASKGKDAFLSPDGWVTNTDKTSGNRGKPLRRYRLKST